MCSTIAVSLGIILSGVNCSTTMLPFVLVTLYIMQRYYFGATRYLQEKEAESKLPLQSFLAETLDGLLHIRAFGWEHQAISKGYHLLDASQKPLCFMLTSQCWVNLAVDLIVLSMVMIILPFALDRQVSRTATGVALSLFTLFHLGHALGGTITYQIAVEDCLLALGRIRKLIRTAPQERPGHGDVPLTWPENGHIEMYNVNARYE